MKKGKEKIMLPPEWIESSLVLPSPVVRGTNTQGTFIFRYNRTLSYRRTFRFVLSYSKHFNLTAPDIPKNVRASYSRERGKTSFVLDFEISGQKGLIFQEVIIFLTLNPSTPLGKHEIVEKSLVKTPELVRAPKSFGKGEWTPIWRRSPTPEEIRQPGTVTVGIGVSSPKSKPTLETRYSIKVV